MYAFESYADFVWFWRQRQRMSIFARNMRLWAKQTSQNGGKVVQTHTRTLGMRNVNKRTLTLGLRSLAGYPKLSPSAHAVHRELHNNQSSRASTIAFIANGSMKCWTRGVRGCSSSRTPVWIAVRRELCERNSRRTTVSSSWRTISNAELWQFETSRLINHAISCVFL